MEANEWDEIRSVQPYTELENQINDLVYVLRSMGLKLEPSYILIAYRGSPNNSYYRFMPHDMQVVINAETGEFEVTLAEECDIDCCGKVIGTGYYSESSDLISKFFRIIEPYVKREGDGK